MSERMVESILCGLDPAAIEELFSFWEAIPDQGCVVIQCTAGSFRDLFKENYLPDTGIIRRVQKNVSWNSKNYYILLAKLITMCYRKKGYSLCSPLALRNIAYEVPSHIWKEISRTKGIHREFREVYKDFLNLELSSLVLPIIGRGRPERTDNSWIEQSPFNV